MKQGGEVKNILKFCTIEGLYKRLDKIEGELKVCEKALNEFLDSKKMNLFTKEQTRAIFKWIDNHQWSQYILNDYYQGIMKE